MTARQPLVIRDFAADFTAGVFRAAAEVDGGRLLFETPDMSLEPAVEAFAGPVLLAALATERPLVVEAPVCPEWYARVPQAVEMLSRWYDLPRDVPRLATAAPTTSPRPDRTGLCFTGGVDSFHSLLCGEHAPDTLVYVVDYDIKRKQPRMPRFEPSFRDLCASIGVRPVVIRTNLKRYLDGHGLCWTVTHGTALAAVGHLLRGHVGRWMIASTETFETRGICGSRWDLDPLWSSSRLEIVHSRPDRCRLDKVRDIAANPLVQRHLRPCWEHPDGRLNCAECEKCVRTQLALLVGGQLEHFAGLAHEKPLLDRLRAVPKIRDPRVYVNYEEVLEAGLPRDFQRAVEALLRRSRRSASRRHWRERLKRMLPARRRAA